GVMRDCQIGGSFPIYTIPTVTVTRAVSKLRFVFCQLADSNGAPVDNFAVTGVTLDGQIGAQEKLFTTNVFTPADGRYPTNLFDISGYSTLSKSWTSAAELPQTIALNQTPGDYLFKDGMTAQQYETTIENGVTAGRLTQWGLAYLRETDKILSGTITYTVGGGAPKTTTFTMTAEGDFARNHSWIIYGYFIGGKLYVQPKVIPWIAGQDRFAYNTQSSTKMEYERYVRYDKDKNPSTWTDTWMSVSYGYPENADIGLPLYSPRILIKSINAYTLRVQVDNDKFQLLITNEDKTSFSLAPERQWFEIPPSDQEQNTYFYVVPVDNVSWQEPASITRLFLTEIHGSGGVPPENVPFNHNLPGDEDHTSILIHKISASDYKTTVDTEPAPGTGYYWISN
ncbi:MAG: hypothetical protein IJ636_05595, partial [Bacteroidales bacterium]|nr:hypothetical protein [Bacteroidales bacterium]